MIRFAIVVSAVSCAFAVLAAATLEPPSIPWSVVVALLTVACGVQSYALNAVLGLSIVSRGGRIRQPGHGRPEPSRFLPPPVPRQPMAPMSGPRSGKPALRSALGETAAGVGKIKVVVLPAGSRITVLRRRAQT